MSSDAPKKAATLGIHAGMPEPELGAPVVPPLVQSATFYGGLGEDASSIIYTRHGNNPNQAQVARKIAALEGTESAVVLGSGMAAVAMTILAHVEAGEHIVASRHVYGPTKALLTDELPRRGIETTFVDDPADGDEWAGAVRPETTLLYLEVPTNPTLRIFDPRIPAAVGQERGIPLAADVTFASPINFRGAQWGIDAVIHSATKYLGGHSDLIVGAVAGSEATIDRVKRMMKLYGPSPDPHTAWLLDRGLRTLDLRVRRHNENALRLARFLERRPEVETVHHPGLESHPDHALAAQLLDGFGGMLSFVLRGGGDAADRFVRSVEIAGLAPSLGGVETLVCLPRFTSHILLSAPEREALGIPDGFVRMSVGIEDPEDLERDVERALEGLGDRS